MWILHITSMKLCNFASVSNSVVVSRLDIRTSWSPAPCRPDAGLSAEFSHTGITPGGSYRATPAASAAANVYTGHDGTANGWDKNTLYTTAAPGTNKLSGSKARKKLLCTSTCVRSYYYHAARHAEGATFLERWISVVKFAVWHETSTDF